MDMNRRTIIKAMALAPALPILSSSLARALQSAGSPSFTYILLHGMFFMEFVRNNLYAATPQHAPHQFRFRDHGGKLQNLSLPLNNDIDLSSQVRSTDQDKKVSNFPTSILQFSASSINQSGAIVPSAQKFQYRIKLPLPMNIFALRCDTKDNLHLDTSGKVAQSILASAGPNVATITCLQYDPDPTIGAFVRSYYAEHPSNPGHFGVNAALRAAQDICGANFNLTVLPGFMPPPPNPDSDTSLPTGVTGADETTLEEIGPQVQQASVTKQGPIVSVESDIASCPQFGINHP